VSASYQVRNTIYPPSCNWNIVERGVNQQHSELIILNKTIR